MKKSFILPIMAGTLAFAISCGPKTTETANPFLTEYPNEFDIPDFANIKYEHYIPAIKAGIEAHNQEIDSILKTPFWHSTTPDNCSTKSAPCSLP